MPPARSKLQDQRRCFIQALVDNFSRYILSWHVSLEYGGEYTHRLLVAGLEKLRAFGIGNEPQVLVDGGSENHNEAVNALVTGGQIDLLTAQTEIDASNSMVEAVFHRLKNCHLYLQKLTSVESLIFHTDFYLKEANERIPLQVLRGATPLEVISLSWDQKNIDELKEKSTSARRKRLQINRSRLCGSC